MNGSAAATAIGFRAPYRGVQAELGIQLEAAGFVNRGGGGSHRNFVHPKVARPVTLAGREGGDAKAYQEKAVKSAIREAQQ